MRVLKVLQKGWILAGFVVLTSIFATLPSSLAGATYASNININDLHNLANQERANVGLGALNYNSQLGNAAYNKANYMIANNYWAHVAPDGTTPWYFIQASGYSYTVAGENLAKDFSSSSGVIAGWMASPTHHANVVNSSYQDVGYAVVNGILQGSETTIVVAMYGAQSTPEPVVAAVVAPAAQATPPASTTSVVASSETVTEVVTASEPIVTSSETTPVVDSAVAVSKSDVEPEVIINTKDNSAATIAVEKSNTASLNIYVKLAIIIVGALAIVAVIGYIFIIRKNKLGNKYAWFKKRLIANPTAVSVLFTLIALSGIGFPLRK